MMVQRSPSRVALSALLQDIAPVPDADDVPVTDIALDSREVSPGACFFALQGTRENGMKYAGDAIARGAAVVVAEMHATDLAPGVPVVAVPALHAHLGQIARRFFDDPSAALTVFAVTGTNGKSTVAHLAADALTRLGTRCGYIGTLGAGEIGALDASDLTTPDVISLNRRLAGMRDGGLRAVAIEASSHALQQKRLDGIHLTAAGFTNLGHDHLDFHGDLDAYARSKRLLFAHDQLATAIVNVDDPVGASIAAGMESGVALWTCSSRGANADVVATDIDCTPASTAFTIRSSCGDARVTSRLSGRFNVDNLLLTGAFLLSLEHAPERVGAALSDAGTVRGRMEFCGQTAAGARVFVDYAHSPDSLEAALGALRAFDPVRLIVVFGCGGSRDRSKRPVMGEVAERIADHVILTSDNPRAEDNAEIVEEIAAGMRSPARAQIEHDRASAIRTALVQAGSGDIVLVAGKGHEQSQDSGNRRVAFSDHAEIARLLGGTTQ